MSQTYTLCEIAKNNGENGKPVWLIIKGSVYDVTDMLKEHPGGDETIREYAGKDATKAFNAVGHSTDAIRDMKLYKIGVVANECAQFMNERRKSAIAMGNSTNENHVEECCRKQKKRLKLFFCF